MVADQLVARDITSGPVLRAMREVPREVFVAARYQAVAHDDRPVPIGHGQTISQPYMVALICELADVGPGAKVLDVGSGSGYQAAVLAAMGARVFGVERVGELVDRAREALAVIGLCDMVDLHEGDGARGLASHAPYDAIVLAAAARQLPGALYEQAAPGARIIAPLGPRHRQWLQRIVPGPAGPETTPIVPCRFVPLVASRRFRR